MPNYIDIALSVLGKDQRLGAFTRQANGPRKPTGDLPILPNGRQNINYDCASDPPCSVFEFDRLVPLPESYSLYPYSEHGCHLEMSIWGVKWGAFAHKQPVFEEGCATYEFRCAWDAPRLFLEKASRQWPDLWFVTSYGGEGPIRGRFVLHEGQYLENLASSGYSFKEEHASEEQCDTHTYAYYRQHAAYVKQILFTYIAPEHSF